MQSANTLKQNKELTLTHCQMQTPIATQCVWISQAGLEDSQDM